MKHAHESALSNRQAGHGIWDGKGERRVKGGRRVGCWANTH